MGIILNLVGETPRERLLRTEEARKIIQAEIAREKKEDEERKAMHFNPVKARAANAADDARRTRENTFYRCYNKIKEEEHREKMDEYYLRMEQADRCADRRAQTTPYPRAVWSYSPVYLYPDKK